MFQGFSKSTSDFLWELAFNNEREWFMAHKQEFETVLNTPFKALAKDTFALMEDRYPGRGLMLHTARIYRDARRLHGRGPYKDHLWFSIKASDGLLSGPMFWFEIGAKDYSFGMGFYDTKAADMENFRRTVDANPARFEKLASDAAKSGVYRVSGQQYKKSRGEKSGIIAEWYNRKQLGVECTRDFGGMLYDEKLPQYLAEEFEKLMPLYDFFCEILNMK